MTILIKSAKIIDKGSSWNGRIADVMVKDGKITQIGKDLEGGDRQLMAKGMILSVGWFDLRTSFGDPGFEHKEDIESGRAAAAAGGFTGVALMPNNKPVTQTKNDIGYLKSGNRSALTQIYPIGAVTLENKGEELTEMIDLHTAGAIAFSDGVKPIWHADILLKTLQYLQKFNGVLIDRPEDIHLNMFGVMNEGVNSTVLGMKGMPKLAENIIVQRNLEILDYAGGRLHFSNISTAKSVDLIKKARKKGLDVTCDVAAYQTSFDDSVLGGFDTNFKVNPPFREAKDNKALIKGLQDEIIDVITSSHIPQDEESKKLEFDLADFGVIGLQTVGHNISQLSEQVDVKLLIEKVTKNPRRILGLPQPEIMEGKEADLTLFNPKFKWTLNRETNLSKSINSPYWDQPLLGKTMATFCNDQIYIDGSMS